MVDDKGKSMLEIAAEEERQMREFADAMRAAMSKHYGLFRRLAEHDTGKQDAKK